MHSARHRWTAVGAGLVVSLCAAAAHAAGPQQRDTPTLSNSSLEAPVEPLPAEWPLGAKDVQVRGAVCESGYGKADARAAAAAGDVVLPIVGTATANFESSFLGVRPVPFLTRRDVVQATFVEDPEQPGTYEVRLELTEDGVVKVQEYTANNLGKCIALLAGGKVLWAATIAETVETDVYVLSGSFSSTTALGIVDLFAGK